MQRAHRFPQWLIDDQPNQFFCCGCCCNSSSGCCCCCFACLLVVVVFGARKDVVVFECCAAEYLTSCSSFRVSSLTVERKSSAFPPLAVFYEQFETQREKRETNWSKTLIIIIFVKNLPVKKSFALEIVAGVVVVGFEFRIAVGLLAGIGNASCLGS